MAQHQRLSLFLEPLLSSTRVRTSPLLRTTNTVTVCRRCLSRIAGASNDSGRRPTLPKLAGASRPALSYQTRRNASTGEAADLVTIPSDLTEQHALVKQLSKDLTQDPATTRKVPDEKAVMRVLATYERLVEKLLAGPAGTASPSDATSALLNSLNSRRSGSKITATEVLKQISTQATQIIEAPSVFITASVLKSYINLQSQLGQPQNFPAVFELYRSKPTPQQADREPYMTLKAASPNAASVAVDPAVASTALDAAVKLHSLPLCLDIIDSTYCAPAYAKGKILRNAVVPIAGAALAPAAAYALASKFALLQNTMDPAHATTVAMAGMITYAATVGTMGYIAVTTSNDQMMRVTWATGTPLWERWVREEERAAVDKIAQAWGFRSQVRWGDEEGPEWDMLREFSGLKGMVLDRVELMQGMQ